MAIDSEKNYHGFRLHSKYAQSIVVSLIDQWMAEMTNYGAITGEQADPNKALEV